MSTGLGVGLSAGLSALLILWLIYEFLTLANQAVNLVRWNLEDLDSDSTWAQLRRHPSNKVQRLMCHPSTKFRHVCDG